MCEWYISSDGWPLRIKALAAVFYVASYNMAAAVAELIPICGSSDQVVLCVNLGGPHKRPLGSLRRK